jgi:hypothetical protein
MTFNQDFSQIDSIQGWPAQSELKFLHQTSRQCDARSLEIGAFWAAQPRQSASDANVIRMTNSTTHGN